MCHNIRIACLIAPITIKGDVKMRKEYTTPVMEITYMTFDDIVCSSGEITVTITTPVNDKLGETPPVPYGNIMPN